MPRAARATKQGEEWPFHQGPPGDRAGVRVRLDQGLAIRRGPSGAPAQSLADLVELFPDVRPPLAKAQLDAQTQLPHTPATQGKTVGRVAPGDVAAIFKVLERHSGLQTSKPAGALCTDPFAPAS